MDYVTKQLIGTDGEYEDIIGFIADMHFHQEPIGDILQMILKIQYNYYFQQDIAIILR